MADAYSYPLLVEFGQTNIPKLKNKLVKYFQSKKSNGGDCEVDYENGSGTAVLRFRSGQGEFGLINKSTFYFMESLYLRLLSFFTMSACVFVSTSPRSAKCPAETVSSADEPTHVAEVQTESKSSDDPVEELCSTMAVLGNTETLSQEFLEMLVENILKDLDSASQSFTLEVLPGISSAVVTFQSGKESTKFITRCPQNRMFRNKGLSVRPLEFTDQIVVEDIQSVSEDLLHLYFENEGGEVEDVALNQVEQSAIITFKDHKGSSVTKLYHIKQEMLRVYPFYKSLGTALYGNDEPSLKLPAAISEPIDDGIWRYLTEKQSAAETIHSALAEHYCNVNLNNQSTVCLIPMSSLLQQQNAKAIIKEWRDTVKSAFVQTMSKFKSLKLKTESEIWEESEESLREALQNEDVVVVSDKASGVFWVAGLVNDVNRLEHTLNDIINKIVRRLEREKSSVSQEIKMSQLVFHLLRQDGLQDKLLSVYPELKMSYPRESASLTVTGLSSEVMAANTVIFDAMVALKRENLEIDEFVLNFLKDEDSEELTYNLIPNGINAAFEMRGHTVQLIAVSEGDLNNAGHHLRRLLISQYIDVEDSNILQMQEWHHLVSQLEDTNNKPDRKIQIHTTGQQIVVSGHKDNVLSVSSELDEFLIQNAKVEESLAVKHNAILEYIKRNTSSLEQVQEKVKLSYRKEAICLSGSRVDVTLCKTSIEDLISSVFFESCKVSKPGAKTFFKDKEKMYVSTLLSETGCVVQLVEENSCEQDDLALTQVPKPVYQLQTNDGVEIAVCKADLCSYPVCAVINSANQDLKHKGGLAGALLNAAGQQMQDECDKIISSKRKLKPGECVISDAGGKLCCKKIIHAVGPQFDSNTSQKAQALLKKAVRESLEIAERNSCISVALPMISRGQGFPLNMCANSIIKAVKEHCDERYDDSTLRRIHLVNNDNIAVQAMEAAVRQEFGNYGVSHSQQNPQSKATKTPLVKPIGPAGSDPNCLGQVQTKEGLDISLTKGNIEDATTDVTVNTVFEDLSLDKGAVSSAIFKVAGPKLQQLVNANNASGKVGEVIVTEGCNLKSKQVFHVVTPHWDKGQGTAEKVDCLVKAEDTGLTSISFPAIGTGNLGFPKDLVASLMLDELLAFSSKKQLKHLKKVVIILYSGDAKTMQVRKEKKYAFALCGKQIFNMSISSPQSSGSFDKVVSSSGMHETKMGNVAIQVVTGDITKETTDVIVNSSNENFSLKSGVSKAILDAGGQAVQAECQQLGAQPNPGMIMTQPGNLKCKKILHVVGQTDPVKINKTVKNALQMCVKNTYTSVSLPAIGTGQGNVNATQVADAMLDAVIDVFSQYTFSPLKTVRIVIFQAPMLKEFYNSMQQREVTDPKDKGGFWGNIGFKIKSLFISGSSEKPQNDEDFIIEALKLDPACFHICGNSQAEVDSAKQWINDLISKEQDTFTIKDNAILSFSDADYKRIVDIQKTMGVSIRTESKKAQVTITIDGLSKDVVRASKEISEMVRIHRDEEELKKKVDLAGTVAEWQYQQQGRQFQSFDAMTNFELEKALENKRKNVNITIQGQVYTVTMPQGPATNSQGHTLQIKRVDKLKEVDIPEHWDTMPDNVSSQPITIKAGTQEYNEVLTLFQASCNLNITKIERIQNPTLWNSLQIKKRNMEQRNGHQKNMRRLFHGTCHNTVNIINDRGFNRSYAGRNATCYGNGTYFAVNASYSASNTYSKPNQNGEKCMYLCQVLTGDYTAGQQNMIEPPAKGTAAHQLYDSVVDNLIKPSMFIIFHDAQAYPEYLITFK
uniref:Poly [ADP-ribose] polymerase n=1 Tax=Mastacembelus armatus TaxID=205130 RepID=A0A3Q3M6T9_9TELE